MTYGTCYFVNRPMAVRYYRETEQSLKDAVAAVDRKIAEGQIHIGRPPLKDGDTLMVIDGGARYAIHEGILPEVK